MATASNYRIINDELSRKTPGTITTFRFQLPDQLNRSEDGQNLLMIAFDLHEARDLEIEVAVNGSVEKQVRLIGDRMGVLMEAVDSTRFVAGENELTIKVAGGGGAFVIGDLALHYRLDL